MSQQTSTNNHALFQTGPQRKPEATRSWWMDAKHCEWCQRPIVRLMANRKKYCRRACRDLAYEARRALTSTPADYVTRPRKRRAA